MSLLLRVSNWANGAVCIEGGWCPKDMKQYTRRTSMGEIRWPHLILMSKFFSGCFCFQLEVHVRDECPATEVQSGHKNLGFEAVV